MDEPDDQQPATGPDPADPADPAADGPGHRNGRISRRTFVGLTAAGATVAAALAIGESSDPLARAAAPRPRVRSGGGTLPAPDRAIVVARDTG
jgi:hypothetical protein